MKRLVLVLIVVLATACQQTDTTASNGPTGPTIGATSTGPTFSPAPPETTKVPKVEGEKAETAQAILMAANLLVDTETKYTDQVPEGTVLSQTPKAAQR